ncbi:MAG: winged helix-turn-helix transcriptional regulator, partial [Promethearchaeota archaeon]
DTKNPREWYYALMDYGVMLKKSHPELNKRSAHYRKQPKFLGSTRELRGKILRTLLKKSEVPISALSQKFELNSKKLYTILKQLEKEGFLKIKGEKIIVAE